MPRNLAIVDLNGTLTDDNHGGPWSFLPGVVEATRLLVRTCDWDMVIATQQPPKYWRPGAAINDMVAWLDGIVRTLERDADLIPEALDLVACFHNAGDGCLCRKPAPGLLLDAMRGRDLGRVWMIGDKWSDVMAGKAAGVSTCAVGDFGYQQKGTTPLSDGLQPPDLWVPDFTRAVRAITAEVL